MPYSAEQHIALGDQQFYKTHGAKCQISESLYTRLLVTHSSIDGVNKFYRTVPYRSQEAITTWELSCCSGIPHIIKDRSRLWDNQGHIYKRCKRKTKRKRNVDEPRGRTQPEEPRESEALVLNKIPEKNTKNLLSYHCDICSVLSSLCESATTPSGHLSKMLSGEHAKQ